jgi:tryptophan-rich sensory protein
MYDLRGDIQAALIDPNNKEAFNLLYKAAWGPEEAAMGNSTLPTVLYVLIAISNIILSVLH